MVSKISLKAGSPSPTLSGWYQARHSRSPFLMKIRLPLESHTMSMFVHVSGPFLGLVLFSFLSFVAHSGSLDLSTLKFRPVPYNTDDVFSSVLPAFYYILLLNSLLLWYIADNFSWKDVIPYLEFEYSKLVIIFNFF